MGTGQHHFLLTSGPYKTVIPTDSSFCLLARLIFDLEDGGDTFLRNVGSYTDYMALYPRRWQFSVLSTSFFLQRVSALKKD
jgi:hypothetical protein